MQQQQPLGRVQLLVYDLSRGMALTMSQQILGQQIEGIWHTGILVFDVEYYFGGGIQAQQAGMFARQHQMAPARVLDIGVTSKTKNDLQAFLLSLHGRFNASTYDLTRNNCNNFSDTVSQFLTGQRIPSYIVDLPSIVFNTPGGAMLRPMIENMQNAVYSQNGNGLGNQMNQNQQYNQQYNGQNFSQAAQIPAPAAPAVVVPVAPAVIEDMPLVSSDNKTVDLLGKKILNLKSKLKNEDGTDVETDALSEIERKTITSIMAVLTEALPSKSLKDMCNDSTNSFPDDACNTLSHIIGAHPTAQMSCLFLMRLLILEESLILSRPLTAQSMVDALLSRLTAAQGAPNGLSSVPAIVMGLCTLGNLLSHSSGAALICDRTGVAQSVVDIAVGGLSHSRVEVRQMSATVAFNFTFAFLHLNKVLPGHDASVRAIVSADGELNSFAVEILCGATESIAAEIDAGVRYRRLCICLKIVRMGGSTVRALGRDLCLENSLSSIIAATEAESKIVKELQRAFKSVS